MAIDDEDVVFITGRMLAIKSNYRVIYKPESKTDPGL